jgi:hypothetical protein
MFCSKCGAKVDEQWKFCKSCGSLVIVPSDQAPQKELLPESNQELSKQTIEWYYLAGSDKLGPVSDNEISEMIQRGDIKRNTLVWATGFADWIPAGQSPLSSKFGNVVPFAPLNTISDKWIWALACLPAFIFWIVKYFALLNGWEWWVPGACQIVANVFFFSKDIDEIKKAGQDAEAWLYLGLILVPVYLYVRESKTNKKYAPLVVWCVLFFIDLIIP